METDPFQLGPGPGRAERVRIAIVAAAFACAYAVNGVWRHWHFGSSAFDLGIFDQAIWHLGRFEMPASSIRGVGNLLGDHFHPILILFVPFTWVAHAPESLIVAQSALLGASVVPVFLFARTRLPKGPALALSLAYGLFWGMQRTAAYDVHEMAFAPLFVAAVVLAMDRRRWGWFWAATIGLAFVKEDLVPLLAAIGVYLFAVGERRRGAILTGGSLAVFVLLIGVVIPALRESGRYEYGPAYVEILRQPAHLLLALVSPPVKLQTALYWLLPFLFLPLRSPLGLLLVPLVLERFLSSSPNHWASAYHYTAPLAPILAMSAADGLARITRSMDDTARRQRLMTMLTWTCVVVSAILPGHQPLRHLLSPAYYRQTTNERTGDEAVRLIPEGASVVAQAAIVPHLSHRNTIFLLDDPAPDTDFVIAASGLAPWPAERFETLAGLLEDRRKRGYVVAFEKDGWIILRR